jgi:hypothetical protein
MNATVLAIPTHEVLRRIAKSLRMADAPAGITAQLLAQALRRAAYIKAPCPRHELERAVRQSLKGLGLGGDDELRTCTEETLETLLVYGEILEMRTAVDDPWQASPFVLRPAPPSFVVRQDGTVVILGVAGDAITPLPGEMNERVVCRGVLRVLFPEGSEDLRSVLREMELIELSESAWLRLPKVESYADYLAKWRQNLSAGATATAIEGLRILDSTRPCSFYPDRWVGPSGAHSGMYIARRDQRYGAPLWCLVDLENGVPRRFIDLVSRGDRVRPCDIAWRIQMAIDAQTGSPQRFRVRPLGPSYALDFLSPLPSWTERKLAAAGERTERHKSLLSYRISNPNLEDDIGFLRARLWLEPERE